MRERETQENFIKRKGKTLCSKLVSLENELINANVFYQMGVGLYKGRAVEEGRERK